MSEDKNTTAADDLELEGSESASVLGGRVLLDPGEEHAYAMDSEMASLQAKGYVEEACTTQGTVMVNLKTGHRKTIPI